MDGSTRLRLCIAVVLLVSCSAPREDSADLAGRSAIYYAVNQALSEEKCDVAINLIEGVYNTKYSDNEARMLRASAHGCKAGIRFFEVVEKLSSGDISGPNFWPTMAQMFPSVATDGRTESTWYASDALQATLKPGTVISAKYKITADEFNIGSMVVTDHEREANLYLAFASMATIGTMENRYGAPDPVTFAKGQNLPWDTLDKVDSEGCSFASAILNTTDAIVDVAANSSRLSKVYTALNVLRQGMDLACIANCKVKCPITPIDCVSGCPKTLRHRDVCERETPDTETLEACAAAVLVDYVNTSPAGWH